jgi:hypothetical protein
MDSVSDFFQKTFYFAVGLAAYTIDRVEKLDETLAEYQTYTQQAIAELSQVLEEMVQRGEQIINQAYSSSDPETDWQVAPLRRRLLELVNGDEELADRLVEQTALQNPDRSLVWVYEKAIYDLEHDRGAS